MSYYYPYTYLSIPKQHYETLPINTTERKFSPNELREPFELHNHEPLELNAVIKGQLEITLDGRKYLLGPGETLLANPFALHSGKWGDTSGGAEYLTLIVRLPKLSVFNESAMCEPLNGVMEGRFRFDEFYPAYSRIFTYIETIHRLYHDKSPANDALCLGEIFGLIGTLLSSHFHEAEDGRAFHRNVEFLRSVCTFISRNYADDITTKDAAAALYMDMSQFCRAFRRHFGMNFSNHLCQYRVMRAADLYAGSGEPVSFIARSVGFRNYSYFSRSFKRYIGVTPAYYFGRWKPYEDQKESNGESL